MTQRPLLVIVSGAPGAGKTTLGRTISARLGLPFFSKDVLKEALGDELGTPPDVPGSQRLGLAAYRILFSVAARLLEAGDGVVLESNFRRGRSESELRPLVALADAHLVHCTADESTIRRRYAERFARGDRHPVHLDPQRSDGLAADLAAGMYEPLDLAIPTIVAATDDGYEPALDAIVAFVAAPPPVLVAAR